MGTWAIAKDATPRDDDAFAIIRGACAVEGADASAIQVSSQATSAWLRLRLHTNTSTGRSPQLGQSGAIIRPSRITWKPARFIIARMTSTSSPSTNDRYEYTPDGIYFPSPNLVLVGNFVLNSDYIYCYVYRWPEIHRANLRAVCDCSPRLIQSSRCAV